MVYDVWCMVGSILNFNLRNGWLEILGAIGGSAGIVALIKVGIDLYNAKSNKTKVDVSNMQKINGDVVTSGQFASRTTS